MLSLPGLNALLSRRGGDFGTATDRLYIWEPALRRFANSNVFELLFGYGADGQIRSGASLGYAYLFNGARDPFSVHAHNLAIQSLLDAGIVGLSLLVVTVVAAAHRLEALNRLDPQSPVAALLAGMLVVFISGSTEVSPTYRTQEALVFATLLLGAAAGLAIERLEAPASSKSRVDRRHWLPGDRRTVWQR